MGHTPQCKILIRLATEEDDERIEDLFNRDFLRDEPVHSYLKTYRSPFEERQKLPNHGITLVAETVDGDTPKIAGFIMCQIAQLDQPVTPKNFVLRTDYLAGYELFQLVCEIDTQFNIFDRYLVDKALDIWVLSVAEEFRNMGVAKKLCGAALNLADERGLKVAFMDCSSKFSATIAKKVGMCCVSEVSYEEYQKIKGHQLFAVKEPHTHLRRFVRIFD